MSSSWPTWGTKEKVFNYQIKNQLSKEDNCIWGPLLAPYWYMDVTLPLYYFFIYCLLPVYISVYIYDFSLYPHSSQHMHVYLFYSVFTSCLTIIVYRYIYLCALPVYVPLHNQFLLHIYITTLLHNLPTLQFIHFIFTIHLSNTVLYFSLVYYIGFYSYILTSTLFYVFMF